MKQGIGETIMDNLVLPVGLAVLGLFYFIRYTLRKLKI